MTAAWGWLMAEARIPAGRPWLGETELDMWPYRDRTVALLKRYARASVEVGGCRRCWGESASGHASALIR